MSKVFTAKEICERALRVMGAFPISESAAEGEDLREAMFWLDLILAEISGTADWLIHQVPDVLSLTLEAAKQEYVLSTELGSAAYPDDGIQNIQQCWLEDSGGNRSDISIVNKATFEDVTDPDETGTPKRVFIDRTVTPSPTLKTFPTLPADETETYTLKLLVQTFSPNVSPGGVSGNKPEDSVAHGFRPAWQRFLVYRLAVDLSSGAVRRLPDASVRDFQKKADEARNLLEARDNRDNDDSDPIAASLEGYQYG